MIKQPKTMGIWHGQLLLGGARVRFKLLGEILFIEVWDCFTIITGITHDNNNTGKSISVFGVNKPPVSGANNSATASPWHGANEDPGTWNEIWAGISEAVGGIWGDRERWSPDNCIVMIRSPDTWQTTFLQNMEYLALGVISLFKYTFTQEHKLMRPVFMAVDILKYYTEAIFIILPPSI